jgi:hypothetical protein
MLKILPPRGALTTVPAWLSFISIVLVAILLLADPSIISGSAVFENLTIYSFSSIFTL